MVRWCVSDENSWHKIEKYASTFVSPQKQHLTWEMNSVDCHDITTQEQLRNKQKVAQLIKKDTLQKSTSKNQT
jgi:hemerythrin-like domain-containing protein